MSGLRCLRNFLLGLGAASAGPFCPCYFRPIVMGFMERVAPIVGETIKALAKVAFVPDPSAGAHYSRTTSIVSSAYKRHGRILEFALRESLRESRRRALRAYDTRASPVLLARFGFRSMAAGGAEYDGLRDDL